MRDLTYKQAAACENAIGHTCKCRCGGAFHGIARGGLVDNKPDRIFFQSLPENDPHHHAPPKSRTKIKYVQKSLFEYQKGKPE